MASKPLRLVTPRDLDLFRALDRSPLTVRQLVKLSATFAYPFTTERRAQERLQHLVAAGRLRSWRYATTGQGALGYFTLTHQSYRLLHGPDASPPSHGMLGPVGIARQRHTHALAEFLVHLLVAAHRNQVEVGRFRRENALGLQLGSETLYPDSTFELTAPSGMPFRFFVELDCATESVQATGSLDSWQRKINFYERYQDACRQRFRVLAVATSAEIRVRNILGCAEHLARNPRRALVYGVTIAEFLAQTNPLMQACFRDHLGRPVGLLHKTAESVQRAPADEVMTSDVRPFALSSR